ncbi:MAG: homoserine dehydrogenase [Burkholderiaceae bacterium]|nr:homoserine dehydrogenase [Burkholderiaceae bacterium]
MNPIRVGLLGSGIVGSGVFNVLKRNRVEITRRAGREIVVTQICARNLEKAQALVGNDVKVVADPIQMATSAEVDVLVEVIGGTTISKQATLAAINAGKAVVTANKALLASHGNEIFAIARTKGVPVMFEAAVAGGIPIIKALREGLAANHIEWVAGIINGTTNFILSKMRSQKLSFEEALKEAQRLGYAEADPTFDIEGIDAAHKLTLLSAIAFGIPVQFSKVTVEGISTLQSQDIAYAEELGYRIKLLGITRRHENGIELRVHPTLIPARRLIANVEGAMNAVLIKGDAVGATLYYGPGAGSEPTASAIIADLVDVTRLFTADPEHRVPSLAFQYEALADTPILPMSEVKTATYMRLRVADESGVLADITRILADSNISIDALLQKEAEDGSSETDLIILTHVVKEGAVNAAIARMQMLRTVKSKVVRLRMEELS